MVLLSFYIYIYIYIYIYTYIYIILYNPITLPMVVPITFPDFLIWATRVGPCTTKKAEARFMCFLVCARVCVCVPTQCFHMFSYVCICLHVFARVCMCLCWFKYNSNLKRLFSSSLWRPGALHFPVSRSDVSEIIS